MKVKSDSEIALSDPMDGSLLGSSVHGILQARVLEWGAIVFSGEQYESPLKKLKLELPHDPAVTLLGTYLEKTETLVQKHMHIFLLWKPQFHSSTIYNSQDMEATWVSTDRGMDKEDVVHTYSRILLSHEKK